MKLLVLATYASTEVDMGYVYSEYNNIFDPQTEKTEFFVIPIEM